MSIYVSFFPSMFQGEKRMTPIQSSADREVYPAPPREIHGDFEVGSPPGEPMAIQILGVFEEVFTMNWWANLPISLISRFYINVKNLGRYKNLGR